MFITEILRGRQAKIIVNLFFNFILNGVIKYLLPELYVSIFLITPILQQGLLELVLFGDLVINSK